MKLLWVAGLVALLSGENQESLPEAPPGFTVEPLIAAIHDVAARRLA